MERKTKIRVDQAKEKARPELCKESIEAGWTKFSLAKKDYLLQTKQQDNIARVDGNKCMPEEFIQLYESTYTPCCVTNVLNSWPANEAWTTQKFSRKYRNQKFKCGEDDDGYSVKLKMKYFIRYMNDNNDDSPLYIFDSSFSDHIKRRKLLDDFEVPRMFPDDYFSLVGESRRPPYRWFVMGSARSGTGIHIDPLGTSAWNALLRGHKRWCLFPPHTPKHLLKPRQGEAWKQKGEAVTWFEFVYPRVTAPDWPKEYPMIECVQGPSETMFVPGGWWHVVLNLDETIAITQNYCGRVNFPIVWKKTVKGRPKLSKKWYKSFQLKRPDLLKRADTVNLRQDDGNESSSSSSSSSSSDSEIDSDSDSVWSDDEQPPNKKQRNCSPDCQGCEEERRSTEKKAESRSAEPDDSDDSDEYRSASSSPISNPSR